MEGIACGFLHRTARSLESTAYLLLDVAWDGYFPGITEFPPT